MKTHDILLIGGGIFGMTAAIELAQRGHSVGLLNPDAIPHHLAASTDVTKAVRMEYGTDQGYFDMAEICIRRWRDWNHFFGQTLYHEVGFLMLCQAPLDDPRQAFEHASLANLKAKGYPTEHLKGKDIQERFPAFQTHTYVEANYNPIGGYVESGKVVDVLADYARRIGVALYEGQTATEFTIENNVLKAVKTKEGETFYCGHAVVAAGAHTPHLVPELQPVMKATGHPVFFLRPADPTPFRSEYLPVFTADISNTGWYGFPFLPHLGIVKVAKHTAGLPLHPDTDNRRVTDPEIDDLRSFLKQTFPTMAKAPVVYTRRCLYTDTLDGHFWIDHHPTIKGLSVSSGGSGHGMKMGPILGALTADMVERKANPWLERFRWRALGGHTRQAEEARFVENRKL
jgi:glycine/D-amino acid oxidase-like deaminating enzyme